MESGISPTTSYEVAGGFGGGDIVESVILG